MFMMIRIKKSDQEANQAVGDGEGGDQVVGGRVKTPLLLIMIMMMIMIMIMMIMMTMRIMVRRRSLMMMLMKSRDIVQSPYELQMRILCRFRYV